jgi:hypothetical protein
VDISDLADAPLLAASRRQRRPHLQDYNSLMMAAMAAPHMPAPSDDMEISSDAGHVDYELDMDLMDRQDDNDDFDYMLEDKEPDHAAHGHARVSSRDDFMIDDIEEPTIVEDMMQDDEPVHDEYLADVNELPADDGLSHSEQQQIFHEQEHTESELLEDLAEFPEEPLQIPAVVLDSTIHSVPSSAPLSSVSAENTQSLQPIHQSHISPTHHEPTPSELDFALEEQENHEGEEYVDADAPADADDHDTPGEESLLHPEPTDLTYAQDNLEDPVAEAELHAAHSPTSAHSPSPVTLGQKQAASPLPSAAEEISTHVDQQNATSQEQLQLEDDHNSEFQLQEQADEASQDDSSWSSSLHPVKVQYSNVADLNDDDDKALFLFPAESGRYLVGDESVAYKSISELFQNCRPALGDAVEQEELEIFCVDLGLCISEVSVSPITQVVFLANRMLGFETLRCHKLLSNY